MYFFGFNVSVYLSKLTYCICLGALERALEKFDRFKDERYNLIAENQIWFEKCVALESEVEALKDSRRDRDRSFEQRIEYWRKMYCALCRMHKRLVRKHSRCPKKTMFLYR